MTTTEKSIVTPPSVLAKAYRIVVDDLQKNPMRYLGVTTMRQRADQLLLEHKQRAENIRVGRDFMAWLGRAAFLDSFTICSTGLDFAEIGADIRRLAGATEPAAEPATEQETRP